MTPYDDALARWAAAVWRDRYASLRPEIARERIRKAHLYGHLSSYQAKLLLEKVPEREREAAEDRVDWEAKERAIERALEGMP